MAGRWVEVCWPDPGLHALALRPEDTEYLGWLVASAAGPVRDAGVELSDFAGAKDDVVVGDDQAHAAGPRSPAPSTGNSIPFEGHGI
jgi:hypothetical protein